MGARVQDLTKRAQEPEGRVEGVEARSDTVLGILFALALAFSCSGTVELSCAGLRVMGLAPAKYPLRH